MERQVSVVGKINHPAAKGCGILAGIIVVVPLLVVSVVGVKTWMPLHEAGEILAELNESLGSEAVYRPASTGEISAERMERFLRVRTSVVLACEDYGSVQRGFESVASLETKESGDLEEVAGVARDLGGASLAITPFFARFLKRRNAALLEASMGLQEYSYIYALAYHDQLLSEQTRDEIFSDGAAVSLEAALVLRGCLTRQLESMAPDAGEVTGRSGLESELKNLGEDPSRLVWQDGLPGAITASFMPYRERLDRVFCGATAGLEMEQNSRRALRVALE